MHNSYWAHNVQHVLLCYYRRWFGFHHLSRSRVSSPYLTVVGDPVLCYVGHVGTWNAGNLKAYCLKNITNN